MAALLNYLKWRGDLPMERDGFNELDAAILAWLSYLPFELVSEDVQRQGVPLTELTAYLAAVPGIEGKVMRSEDLELCRQAAECERYAAVKVYRYERRWDAETETQFAALTFILPGGLCAAAYRGTDNTLVGWKEDLNMGLTFPIPAQVSAAEYLEETAEQFADDRLIVCGHSKGGNLAVYAGAFCSPEIQSRISAVYNFDGPGFEEPALSAPGYRAIYSRILTYVPEFSVIGMLFENDRPYFIVKSTAAGIMQHNIASWEAERCHFLYADSLAESSRMLDSSIGMWFRGMSADERAGVVDTIYQILTQNKAKTIDQISLNKLNNAMMTFRTIKRLDEKTRSNTLKALQLLVQSFKTGVLTESKAAQEQS